MICVSLICSLYSKSNIYLLHYSCPAQIGQIASVFTFLERIYDLLLLLLVGTFITVILIALCIWSVEYNMSLLATFMAGCNFISVVIFVITVTSLCALLRKRNPVLWWSGCSWYTVIIFIKHLLWLYHVLRELFLPFV